MKSMKSSGIFHRLRSNQDRFKSWLSISVRVGLSLEGSKIRAIIGAQIYFYATV